MGMKKIPIRKIHAHFIEEMAECHIDFQHEIMNIPALPLRPAHRGLRTFVPWESFRRIDEKEENPEETARYRNELDWLATLLNKCGMLEFVDLRLPSKIREEDEAQACRVAKKVSRDHPRWGIVFRFLSKTMAECPEWEKLEDPRLKEELMARATEISLLLFEVDQDWSPQI
jgi:hypothetical protein